jgi:transposase-like protein
MPNKYIKCAKVSEAKFRLLIRYFAHDLDATSIASLTALNRNTVNRYLTLIRKRIAAVCEHQHPFKKQIEVGELYLGNNRIMGKHGRSARKKKPFFGILKHGGNIYTEIVPDLTKETLKDVIRSPVISDSIIHSGEWLGYSGLIDLGNKKYYRVKRLDNQYVNSRNRISETDSFWSFAKSRLRKFNGISDSAFYLHLKECEFRFNYRKIELNKILLKMFRNNPLP